MLASGIATSAALLLFPFLWTVQASSEEDPHHWDRMAIGLGLALLSSVLLRTVNYSLDYSLQSAGGWVGWGLGILLGFSLKQFNWGFRLQPDQKSSKVTFAIVGIFMVLALCLFGFAAPAVIARWTEADYRLIIIVLSLLTSIWVLGALYRPEWLDRVSSNLIFFWNILFTLSLCATLLAARLPFPPNPDSPPLVVGSPGLGQQILLLVTVVLFPVLFFDLRLLGMQLERSHPSPRDFAGGMLLGAFLLVLLIFMQIFTNVWGYVEPVSPWFRNKFWLPYFLMACLLTWAIGRAKPKIKVTNDKLKRETSLAWGVLIGGFFLGSSVAAFLTTQVRAFEQPRSTLKVMTYNIQQANDVFGERSFSRQLAQIQKINPDILALQESDSARVSLNNVDIVRYYAGKLGYYSYYGPSPVSGTYGTAILSKYPLSHTHVVYSYSDKDEIGTTVAEIEVAGKIFTVYDVHPDGTDTAMLVFAQTLLEQINAKEYVIALGDYNLRDYEKPYQVIAAKLTNAWESLYPSKISPDGIDMSGENRIDHIFFSAPLKVIQAGYILPPDSATDHPLHWAEIGWEK
ncbi:MAG: endonuclease/exonuclease/phosphatase family protein, partial [Anaerolineales bacterium]